MIRLLALVQKDAGIAPNQRFRIEQWAPFLASEHGIQMDFTPFESPELTRILYHPGHTGRKIALCMRDALRRARERERVRSFDAVLVVREASMLGGAWFEGWLARHGVPFIFDFDDAIWRTAPSATSGFMSLARMPWKVSRICRLAAAVTVGNEYLAEFARRHNPSVHIVRTSIDINKFPVLEESQGEPFTVVWTGSHSTLQHLEMLRPVLERLGARRPLRLRVVCDVAPPPFQHVMLDFIRWSASREAQDLAPGHVGIMPLPDDLLTRGKCGCKALQYMAIGRPAVVSPVGMNREIVKDHVNGRYASTLDDWERVLGELAMDHATRLRMGRAARRTVEEGFTARRSAAAFADVVRGILPGVHASEATRAPMNAHDPLSR